jgi:prolyl-tRNA synthetase
MDEAKARLGGMLANTELMGIPHRVVIGEKGLDKGLIEYRNRKESENQELSLENLESQLLAKVQAG